MHTLRQGPSMPFKFGRKCILIQMHGKRGLCHQAILSNSCPCVFCDSDRQLSRYVVQARRSWFEQGVPGHCCRQQDTCFSVDLASIALQAPARHLQASSASETQLKYSKAQNIPSATHLRPPLLGGLDCGNQTCLFLSTQVLWFVVYVRHVSHAMVLQARHHWH